MSEPTPPAGPNRWPPASAAPSRPVQVWTGSVPTLPVGSPNPTFGWGASTSSTVGPSAANRTGAGAASFSAGAVGSTPARVASAEGSSRLRLNRDLIWLLIAVIGLVVLLGSFVLWDRPVKIVTPVAHVTSARPAFAVLPWPALPWPALPFGDGAR